MCVNWHLIKYTYISRFLLLGLRKVRVLLKCRDASFSTPHYAVISTTKEPPLQESTKPFAKLQRTQLNENLNIKEEGDTLWDNYTHYCKILHFQTNTLSDAILLTLIYIKHLSRTLIWMSLAADPIWKGFMPDTPIMRRFVFIKHLIITHLQSKLITECAIIRWPYYWNTYI